MASIPFPSPGAVCALVALVLPAVAQTPLDAYQKWLDDYSAGRIVMRAGQVADAGKEQDFRKLFEAVAQGDDLAAAKALWRAATVELSPSLDQAAQLQARLGYVRDYAKRMIAAIADPAVDDFLLDKALSVDRRGKVDVDKIAALEVLGMRSPEAFAEKLLPRLGSFAIPERSQAILALEKARTPSALPILLKLVDERAIEVRIAALQTLCGVLAYWSDETDPGNQKSEIAKEWIPLVLDKVGKVLAREKVWQVEAAAVDSLVRLKHHAVIPVLIDGYRNEARKGTKRNDFVMESYHLALVGLTGQELPRDRPEFWERFWEENGSGFRYAPVDPKAGKGGKAEAAGGDSRYVKYFNLDIRSKRILFVIDFSGSMREKVRLRGRYAGGNEHVKYELVKRELEKVVRALPKDTICNVVFFNHEVSAWRMGKAGPALVEMTDTNKSDLLQFVWETNPAGATNLYGALKLALDMGGRGVHDKYYGTAYDTLFVLSDGAPTYGEIQDTDLILKEVAQANKLRRIRIHSIVFGDATNNLRFMRALAEQNQGQFHHVE